MRMEIDESPMRRHDSGALDDCGWSESTLALGLGLVVSRSSRSCSHATNQLSLNVKSART